jgi:NADH:ubiquinone oxidoreductase subunit 6 (subunit J)
MISVVSMETIAKVICKFTEKKNVNLQKKISTMTYIGSTLYRDHYLEFSLVVWYGG